MQSHSKEILSSKENLELLDFLESSPEIFKNHPKKLEEGMGRILRILQTDPTLILDLMQTSQVPVSYLLFNLTIYMEELKVKEKLNVLFENHINQIVNMAIFNKADLDRCTSKFPQYTDQLIKTVFESDKKAKEIFEADGIPRRTLGDLQNQYKNYVREITIPFTKIYPSKPEDRFRVTPTTYWEFTEALSLYDAPNNSDGVINFIINSDDPKLFNTPDRRGNYPLGLAAGWGALPIVNQLLTVIGIEINAQNSFGDTALMMAAFGGHKAVVEALLAKGADVIKTDTFGDNAATQARKQGHSEVADIIEAKTPKCVEYNSEIDVAKQLLKLKQESSIVQTFLSNVNVVYTPLRINNELYNISLFMQVGMEITGSDLRMSASKSLYKIQFSNGMQRTGLSIEELDKLVKETYQRTIPKKYSIQQP